MASNTQVDLLDEDKPIAGQKFSCISFVSPENHIKQRELYYFENFVKNWDMVKSIDKFQSFLNFIGYKYNLQTETINSDLQEFLKEERKNLMDFTIYDDYKTFLDNKQDDLDKEYNTSHNFQTNVRGIKVRGVYSTQEEAEMRCKTLRENDPNHDVYVGPVGLWMPWEPEAYKTGRVEYLEKELNDLMHEKYKNETKVKEEFEKRTKESKLNAIQKNLENAKKNGSKLTQTINDKGELVDIKNMNETDKFLGVNADLDEIKEKMFQDNNIKTKSETQSEQVEPVLEQVE